jgi:hypothetical protein
VGDSFYMWDFDRSSLLYFMTYLHRILLHMIGYSSLVFFSCNGKTKQADKLRNGMVIYWAVGAAVLALTRSFSFFWWIYLEPLLCMTFFLALLNIGFHGFIEFDKEGKPIPMVNATTILEGQDDFFGEYDHMAHHYNSSVYYRNLPAHQASKREEFRKHRASVFREISIVELSIFILLGLWEKLADYYVDFSDDGDKLSREELIKLLKERAQRCECSYDEYLRLVQNPTEEARKAFQLAIQRSQAQ